MWRKRNRERRRVAVVKWGYRGVSAVELAWRRRQCRSVVRVEVGDSKVRGRERRKRR